jgi:hypothetical protein
LVAELPTGRRLAIWEQRKPHNLQLINDYFFDDLEPSSPQLASFPFLGYQRRVGGPPGLQTEVNPTETVVITQRKLSLGEN